MGGKATPRHLTLPLRKFRDYMLGRKYINNLRFYEYDMVPKSQPQPNLPPGPHDQLSGVPYYARDARNFKDPGEVVAETPGAADRMLLAEGGEYASKNTAVSQLAVGKQLPKRAVPGKVYDPKIIDTREES